MSKMTIQYQNYQVTVQELNGTIFIHKIIPGPQAQSLTSEELIFSGSPEEASYLASTIRLVLGQEKIATPKEKIETPSTES